MINVSKYYFILRERTIPEETTAHWYSKNITPGLRVQIVLKKDQGSEKRVTGVVKDILTKKARHTRGVKVRLVDGKIGRVQKIEHGGKRGMR